MKQALWRLLDRVAPPLSIRRQFLSLCRAAPSVLRDEGMPATVDRTRQAVARYRTTGALDCPHRSGATSLVVACSGACPRHLRRMDRRQRTGCHGIGAAVHPGWRIRLSTADQHHHTHIRPAGGRAPCDHRISAFADLSALGALSRQWRLNQPADCRNSRRLRRPRRTHHRHPSGAESGHLRQFKRGSGYGNRRLRGLAGSRRHPCPLRAL